ncbi:hypothetical protein ACIBJE_02290 [Micromonospora sp. NPDC050187]|uniref:hypothetical protein n=1 Tax=Micromonospora sp. NPDC050187 TaxID=3364277 RepID=UPI0037A823B1
MILAFGLVLILTGALALLLLACLRALARRAETIAEQGVKLAEQAILIRHQSERIAAYRAELGRDLPAASTVATAMAALTPDAADLLPYEVAGFLASLSNPAKES